MKSKAAFLTAVVVLLAAASFAVWRSTHRPAPQARVLTDVVPENPDLSPTNAQAVIVSEGQKGKVLQVKVGDDVEVLLHSTYWTIKDPDAKLLKPLMTQPKVTPDFKGVPGSGSGTVEMRYRVLAGGTVKIIASRTSCGEAMRCTGSNGAFETTIVSVP
mgnify:CR=1 FL=1